MRIDRQFAFLAFWTGFFGSVALAQTGVPASSGDDIREKFEFKGMVAGQPVDRKSAGLRGCIRSNNENVCIETTTVAGWPVAQTVTLVNGYIASIKIGGHRSAHDSILSSFIVKYGEPCEVRNDVWQNAMGARLEYRLHKWCFSSGELTLREIGNRINSMEAEYIDRNMNRAHSPVIDF